MGSLGKYEIHQAFTIKDAKEYLLKENFDFILLNLILPDGEGEEIAKMKRKGLTSKIIVFTSDNNTKRREELFFLGILDFVSKSNPYEYILDNIVTTIDSIEKNKNTKILIVNDSKFVNNLVDNGAVFTIKLKRFSI